jgi:hypothetical protein
MAVLFSKALQFFSDRLVSLVKKSKWEAESLKKFFINPLTCLEMFFNQWIVFSGVLKFYISHKIFINHSFKQSGYRRCLGFGSANASVNLS